MFYTIQFKIFNLTSYNFTTYTCYSKNKLLFNECLNIECQQTLVLLIMVIHIRLLVIFTAGSFPLLKFRCAFKSMLFACVPHCCAACLAGTSVHLQNVLGDVVGDC